MYKHQDPLNTAYVQLIRESGHEDHRQSERDEQGHATKVVKQPGLHVRNLDEVVLKNKDIVPGEVEFTAEWGNEDFESPEGRSRIRTHDAGFTINIAKVYIPANFPQEHLDAETGKPGVYKPGMDISSLIDQNEVDQIIDGLTASFNDRSGWGDTNHYLPDPKDNV